MTRPRLVVLTAAALLAGCSNVKGPTAPSGTDLAGTWRSDTHEYKASGLTVPVYFEFVVDATSTNIVRARMYTANAGGGSYLPVVGATDDGYLPSSIPASIPIQNGRAESKTRNLDFRVAFRSEREADGEWSDTDVGPAGYDFTGTESFDWHATKTKK